MQASTVKTCILKWHQREIFWPKDIRIGVAAQELRVWNGVAWQRCASLLNPSCCHNGTRGARGKILPRWLAGRSFKSLPVSFTHVNILAFLNLFFPRFLLIAFRKTDDKTHSCLWLGFPTPHLLQEHIASPQVPSPDLSPDQHHVHNHAFNLDRHKPLRQLLSWSWQCLWG